MLKAKAPSPIPYIAAAIVLLAAGYGWFYLRSTPNLNPVVESPASPPIPPPPAAQSPSQPSPSAAQPSSPRTAQPTFSPPASVPTGTIVRMDGSTSMVTVNQNLKRSFEQTFPGTQVITGANGSTQGIQSLLAKKVDVAAISRPLTPIELQQGLQSVPVGADAIAIVVGINNLFQGSLSPQQVQGIFQGTIVNWSQVGGANKLIRVINRPPISGTHQTFKDLVLQGGNFGTTTNITTLSQDATTPLLRALGTDGIGYATDRQVMNQKTVRIIPIAGLQPSQDNYPYRRKLYYAYQTPPNPAVNAFLGYTLSPQGQQAMAQEP